MQRTGRALTTSLTLPIIATAAASVKMGIDFQQQMELIHTQAGAAQREVDQMNQAVLRLAPSTRYGPEELAKALYHIESVGDRGKVAMEVLKVAAQGAATGNANLEDTASALVGTMRVFHEPASRAASVMGDLNAVVGAGNMRMQDLNNAIGTGLLPTAQGMGLSIREVGAALAVMTDESTPAQVAATRMRTLLLLMSGETKKSTDVLHSLGIKSLEMGHLMHTPGGMIPALELLKTHLDAVTKDPTLQTQFLAKAFGGARSSGTIIQLLNNLEFVRTKLAQINRTAGNFPAAVIATQQTEVYKLHSAWAAVQAVLIQIGGIIAPFVSEMAAGLARLLQRFQELSPHMQKIIVFGSLIVAALGPVIWIVGTVLTTMDALIGVVAALLSPVGLVVAAIAGLVFGFVELWRHSEAFRNAVTALGDTLKADGIAVFNAVRNVLSALGSIFQGTGVTWQQVGQRMADALQVVRNAANVVTRFVVSMFNEMANGIRAHSQEIRQFVTTVWNAILAVTRTVWPTIRAVIETAWAAIKIIVQTAMRVIGNVILAVMDIISGNWRGAWNAIKAATGALVTGIARLIVTILRGIVPLALAAAEAIGKALWDGIKRVVGFLASLPGLLIGALGRAISSAASFAAGAAVSIGRQLAAGAVSGIGDLAGALAGKIHGAISGALHIAGGLLHGSGPFEITRHVVGEPLARGVIEGFLLGISPLPSKMKQKLQDALQQAQQVVQAHQSTFQTAFQRLADYGMRAFDARTEQNLNRMKTKFDALIKKNITDPLQQALDRASAMHETNAATIGAARDTLTPAEAQLQQMQDAHAEAQRQTAIAQATAALSTAQSTGSADDILKAQGDLNDALYEETIASLQKTAEAQRAAANDAADAAQKVEDQRYKDAQDAIQARYDQMQAALQATYDRQVLNYQAQRDLQKQNLQDQLDRLQAYLNLHPEAWKRVHAQIMAMFHDSFGPNYVTAGDNLGKAFATGIRQSFGSVRSALSELADLVAKYLKLRSPAELGPLSDLHTWWTAFTPTLLSGLDTAAMEDAISGALRPRVGSVGVNTSAGGSLTQTGARAGNAPLVNIEHQHVYNDTDPLAAAITLGRKLAFR